MRFFEDSSVGERIETRGRTITEVTLRSRIVNERGEDAAVSVLKVLIRKTTG
jgi:acyl dehydratase